MKHFKKWMALALAGGMTLSVALVGCAEEHTEHIDEDGNGVCDVCGEEMPETGGTDEVKITDGAWLDAESMASLKLHEDGSFYMVGVFVNASGSWELTDTATKYYKIESGATPAPEDDQTEYTSEQSIVFTGYTSSGGRFDHTVAFAENTIWNCTIAAGAEMTRTLHQNAEYEWDESEETAIEVARVCMPKDQNANIVLYHDGTFASQLGDYTEGTWTQTDAGYAMKDENGADYGVLTAVENGSCTFTPAGGTAVTLYDEAWTPSIVLTGSAEATFAGESSAETATFTVNLWAQDSTFSASVIDGSYKAYEVAEGSYASNSDGSITLTYGDASATVTVPDGEGNVSASMTFGQGEVFASDVTVTLTGKSAVREAVTSFTAADVTVSGVPGVGQAPADLELVLYNDGTAELQAVLKIAQGMNFNTVVDRATYTADFSGAFPAYAFVFDAAGEIATEPDYATATQTGITLNLAYSVEDAACTTEMNGTPVKLSLTFEATLQYSYSTISEVGRFTTSEDITVSGVPGVGTAATPVTVIMYSDNSMQLVLSIFGNTVVVDEGTYAISANGELPSITLTFEKAGEIAAAPDYTTATGTGITFDLTYTADAVSVTAMENSFEVSFEATMHYAYTMA